MRSRLVVSWLAGGVVLLAACGSPSTTEPAASDAPIATDAPTAELPAQPDGTAAPSVTVAQADTKTSETIAPAIEGSAPESTQPESTQSDSTEPTTAAPTATEPAATEPPAAAALDAGCSADNTATDVADGPLPTLEVRAESLASPLPDLAVRQINCAGGWVNLKNALPNDQPLLVWFWAPH